MSTANRTWTEKIQKCDIFRCEFVKCNVLVPCVCDESKSIGISWTFLENTLAWVWSTFWTRLRAIVNNWKVSQWALELRMKVPLAGQEATVNCVVWPTRKRCMRILYLVQQGLKTYFKFSHQLASFLRLSECSFSGFRCNLRVWFPEFTGWAVKLIRLSHGKSRMLHVL